MKRQIAILAMATCWVAGILKIAQTSNAAPQIHTPAPAPAPKVSACERKLNAFLAKVEAARDFLGVHNPTLPTQGELLGTDLILFGDVEKIPYPSKKRKK